MNALNFIKEHGVDRARECIEEANAYGGFWVNAKTLELSNQIPSYDAVSIPVLKRLVESVDIITKVGGIREAIEEHTKWMHAPELHLYRIGENVERLKQAIADYAEIYKCTYCNGFGEVGCQFEGTFTCPDCNGDRYVGGEHV